ncbi:MAG: amidase [Bryobacterales bacterium]|nr:amidase [Bryobacterales bacterium]
MPYRSSLCLMASLVRERHISPVELLEAHLRQIGRRNPHINAFVTVLEEGARAAARKAESAVMRSQTVGLLHGVPLTVKDSFDIGGLPTLCGSRLRSGHRAAEDSTAVARLRDAGAVILGKTSCPEFLLNYETDNYITGRANNPWDPDCTPGGSSGGEAAAIAALCSPGGIGSDAGGSLRLPAHFCGISALKPTPGRISAAGHFPAIGHPGGLLGVAGPMARSARDLRLLFSVLAGFDSQDPFSAPVPLHVPALEGLRVGLWESFYRVPVQASISAAAAHAARKLGDLKIPVEPFEPAGLERAPNLWWFFFGQLPARTVHEMLQGREAEVHWTGSEMLNRALQEPEPSAQDVLRNLAARDRMRAALLRQMERCRVLLMPACGVPAFRHRERRWETGAKAIGLFEAAMPLTPWNLLGLPSVVIPFGLHEDRLPVGVQLVGRPYEEELLLELAIHLEEARGPFPSPPEGSPAAPR